MMERCFRQALAELNNLSDPPTWVGSSTDISECMRALENYQPDSFQGLRQHVTNEILIQIPEMRNIFRYERGTQQKRDDWDALTSLFECEEYEMPFQCPPNSPEEISADVDLSVLTPRMQIRQLCKKFISRVRSRGILYYTGCQWDQPTDYIRATSAYKSLLEDYDTIHRRHALERAIANVYHLPNLTDYVYQRAIGIRFPQVRVDKNK
ncbi:hypothetical protein OROGR_024442 [Orobanche gracilis]